MTDPTDTATGWFRIARRFEIESGHRLSRHPEKCSFPHGHTRVIEVVLESECLDEHAMVCDYQALKTVVAEELERFDHAMLLAADDPLREQFAPFAERVVLLEDDPTTEVMARHLYRAVRNAFRPGMAVKSPSGAVYRVPGGVRLVSVKVWETSRSWAEYGER